MKKYEELNDKLNKLLDEKENKKENKNMKNYKVNVDCMSDMIYFKDEDRGVYEIVEDMLDAWKLNEEDFNIASWKIEEHSYEKDCHGEYCDHFFIYITMRQGGSQFMDIYVY